MTGEAMTFYVLAGMIVTAAAIVVQSKNIVHAGVSLVPVLLGVAGLYVLLRAEFLTVVQILIYVGAITVLLLFVILLTEGATGLRTRQRNEQVPLAAAVAGLFLVGLVALLARAPWAVTNQAIAAYNISAVGTSLFTTYVLVFEIAGLLILASLVGAIVIARKES
jgi:NADH-quinone oxidoreductase subunit J